MQMTTQKSKRLQSLDAFRGFTIAGMILVNTPGSWSYIYPPLAHADWRCTPTDLVFPFFLFIVGVSMWFSFAKFDYRLSRQAVQKIGRRTALIFIIGLLLNAFPFYNLDLSHLRIMGVLQRIALAFGLGSLVCLYFKNAQNLLILSVATLLGYWGLLYFGGGEAPYSLESNLVRQVDLKILGADHLWQGKGIPFDPEGLLSTIPAVITVVLGFLTGRMIATTERKELVSRMLIAGLLFTAIGWGWGQFFPINKALWTSSYVMYTTGIAFWILALFLWLIDVKKYQSWAAPFIVFGMNSLFAYVLSIVWVKILFTISWDNTAGASVNAYQWLYEAIMVPLAGNLNGSLLFALIHILFFWLILWMLYRRRIFIKV